MQMQNKSTLFSAILITVCVFLLVITISTFRSLKKMELEFNEKKATLVKEGLELKDKLNSLQEDFNKKAASVGVIEKEKKELESQIDQIKEEQGKIISSYTQELDALKKKNEFLKKSISALERSPLITRIRAAIMKEDNEDIKKLLQNTLDKIELIKSGKSVNLEPIVVTKKEDSAAAEYATMKPEGREGAIISLDPKNNLMVINLGTKDNLKEGNRCKILRDGQEIAQAEILSVRYRIAAAFIDDIQYRYTINDIKEGYKVVVTER